MHSNRMQLPRDQMKPSDWSNQKYFSIFLYIDALETNLAIYNEPSPKYAKNAKSKQGTSFLILRVFPWCARPISEGLGCP